MIPKLFTENTYRIALLFGIGNAFDSVVSLVAYAFLLKKEKINILKVEWILAAEQSAALLFTEWCWKSTHFVVYYLYEQYCATAQKEIDHEKTDTDIIIRADVYRMRWDKQ